MLKQMMGGAEPVDWGYSEGEGDGAGEVMGTGVGLMHGGGEKKLRILEICALQLSRETLSDSGL